MHARKKANPRHGLHTPVLRHHPALCAHMDTNGYALCAHMDTKNRGQVIGIPSSNTLIVFFTL